MKVVWCLVADGSKCLMEIGKWWDLLESFRDKWKGLKQYSLGVWIWVKNAPCLTKRPSNSTVWFSKELDEIGISYQQYHIVRIFIFVVNILVELDDDDSLFYGIWDHVVFSLFKSRLSFNGSITSLKTVAQHWLKTSFWNSQLSHVGSPLFKPSKALGSYIYIYIYIYIEYIIYMLYHTPLEN